MLFGNDPNDRFRPKKVSFKEVYQHAAKRHTIDEHDHQRTQQALKAAGYSNDKIERLLQKHEAIPVAEMRKLAGHLQNAGVRGFDPRQDMSKLVNDYVRGQMVKKRNIAYVRAEHVREAMRENLHSVKPATPKATPAGKGPRLPF